MDIRRAVSQKRADLVLINISKLLYIRTGTM